MSTITGDYCTKISSIETVDVIRSLGFRGDGRRFVGGGDEGTIREWDIQGGEEEERGKITAGGRVLAIALSTDGKWIISGTTGGVVTVWDASTREKVGEVREHHGYFVRAVDVSSSSTRFATASDDYRALVCSISSTSSQVTVERRLCHTYHVVAVKFSPAGDRLATATRYGPIRIWDGHGGQSLMDIQVEVSWCNNATITPLAWSSSDPQKLFAIASDGKVKSLDSSTGLVLVEWSTPRSVTGSSIVLARNGEFIVSTTNRSITFWSTSTSGQIEHTIEHTGSIRSIALSADNNHLVVSGQDKRIVVWSLRGLRPPESFVKLPFICVSIAAFKPWLQDDIANAEAVLSKEVDHSSPTHDTFANRALVRARSERWAEAYFDAQKSIVIQPSVIGHIAKTIALIGQKKCKEATWAFRLAIRDCDPDETKFLLLIDCIISYAAGDYDEAILCVTELISVVDDPSVYYMVQAQMCARLGDSYAERGDWERALQSFKRAHVPAAYRKSPHLEVVSLIFGWTFDDIGFAAQRRICETLLALGRARDISESLHKIADLSGKSLTQKESSWISDFRRKCAATFETNGDLASSCGQYVEAVGHYSVALSFDPPIPARIFAERSKAQTSIGQWQDAVRDANKAIELDSSSPLGYERKHAALYGLHRYDEAIEALDSMLSCLGISSSPGTSMINPSRAIEVIDSVITQVQRSSPIVLINTETGHLCDKQARARAFKATPRFKELILSPSSHLDEPTVKQEVEVYFRYSTLSHTWEANEPLMRDVLRQSVYHLTPSPPITKLQKFCMTARDAGFLWAWIDTCCIDKANEAVLRESLTSMHQWYHRSSLTIIYLKGVFSQLEIDLEGLVRCLWNTRAWTLQEYTASPVVRFYCEDWKPYVGDPDIFNHKNSPSIIRGMALANGVHPRVLVSLRPGTYNVRQKLRLASSRQATREEDIAYSMLGIFDVTILPIYGEGHRALGRLLEVVLTRSGDTSILDWTGTASSYNSCLPAEISVYRDAPHNPSQIQIEASEMEMLVTELRTFYGLAERIYDRLVDLPSPRLVSGRLSLSCIVFPLSPLTDLTPPSDSTRFPPLRSYSTATVALGDVMIRTADDLSGLSDFVLVHPWLHSLLDPVDHNGGEPLFPPSHLDDGASFLPPSPSRLDRQTRALRLLARLRQPFAALLLSAVSHTAYKRIASDQTIKVQLRRDVSPQYLIDRIKVLDVV